MFWQILITVGASQALTLSVLVLLKRRRSQADYLLSLVLLLMFLIILLYNYKRELFQWMPNLALQPLVLAFLAVSLFFLYTKSATRNGIDLWRPVHAVHLLPYVFANVVIFAYFIPMDTAAKMELLTAIKDEHPPAWWFKMLYYGFFIVVFPAYLYLAYQELRRHGDCILTRFSYTEDVGLSWLNRFLWAEFIVWLAFLGFEVVGNGLFHLTGDAGFRIAFFVMILNIFYLGIYGLRQQNIFLDASPESGEIATAGIEKYQYSSLTTERARRYLAELLQLMERDKPFLEPRITIGELSERSGIPANYLSQIINEQLGQNFFDFINSYRVEEFKRLVQQPDRQHYTLLSLAYEAGFNSKSTFNAIFKKFTGLTPSGYARGLQLGGAPA